MNMELTSVAEYKDKRTSPFSIRQSLIGQSMIDEIG